MTDYKAVAEKLGVRYLFGRWGITLLPRDPEGAMTRWWKLFTIVPLDGWITDEKELQHFMAERGYEL